MQFPQLAQDKANHFVYGAVIAFVALLVLPPLFALAVVVVVALLKEIYDLVSGTGSPEFNDYAATVFGGVIVVGAACLPHVR